MKEIKFKLTAYTDAAGKTNSAAPRNGNEDNMYVCANLGKRNSDSPFVSDKEESLSDYGCLMAVADGMGGMNAGEVASEIAINVVKESFAEDAMPTGVLQSSRSRAAFMESVIVNADKAVKAHAKAHHECEGMGSTIIMAWLYDGQVTVSWCGDSRAYIFRGGVLRQVSKDHSYVQGLVDAGKITPDEAFDHPYGNIITRSLGDPNSVAKPDSVTIPVFKDDIIMVNSDGLSGVLRDSEMEAIIGNNSQEMSACRQALWLAAENADWYDNVTAILCKITDGVKYNPDSENIAVKVATSNDAAYWHIRIKKSAIRMLAIVVLIVAILATMFWLWKPSECGAEEDYVASDSLPTQTIEAVEQPATTSESKETSSRKPVNAMPVKSTVKETADADEGKQLPKLTEASATTPVPAPNAKAQDSTVVKEGTDSKSESSTKSRLIPVDKDDNNPVDTLQQNSEKSI